ncbi:MAG: reverse transcriptase domain-containing protein [Gammaproteobacteria bacterium SHHR-1]
MGQFLFYSVEKGGNFHTPARGICRGSPLSPLLAAFHLYDMDADFARQKGVRYLRYMDDIIILCKSHSQLRRQVARLNRWLTAFGFAKHADKTFIGQVSRGFDWLGYHFGRQGIEGASLPCLQHLSEKIRRYYVQAREAKTAQRLIASQVAEMKRRWCRWLGTGLGRQEALGLSHSLTCYRDHDTQLTPL